MRRQQNRPRSPDARIHDPVVAPVAELSIRADSDEFRRASAWLDRACRERKVPADRIARLDACVNEVLANIITHGGAKALSMPIDLHLEVRRDEGGGIATMTVSDAGTAFDPWNSCCRRDPRRWPTPSPAASAC